MTDLITIAELKEDGRLIIPKDTRKAGDLQSGDMLQLCITVVKKGNFIAEHN